MKTRAFLGLAAGAGTAFFVLAAVVPGEPAEQTAGTEKKAKLKEPSPVKALQAAIKNLAKSKSYRVQVEILGGLSQTEDHAVTEKNVDNAYSADVFGPMMLVSEPKAYRTLKKGVAYVDGLWRDTLTDRRTILLERLFTFPEIILGRALRNAPASARWVKESEVGRKTHSSASDVIQIPKDDAPADEAKKSGEGKSQDSKGRTVVVSKGKAKESEVQDLAAYRIIRVEAPPQEALQNFVEVQNSNCFGGG